MAFRTKKISQMDPKGSNLASTDLLEISQLVSGSYVTKSITGAEIIASIPPSTTAWGTITGTLSSQTDLNTALSGKVPTTRTLTINGTTQDLSADRTFTISTGITIGTTAITSGTVGRVLFEGTGNVVQESANLFWDNTNGRLGIGGTPSTFNLDVVGTARVSGALNLNSSINITNNNQFGLNYILFSALTASQGIAGSYSANGTPSGYAYLLQFNKSSTANGNSLLIIGGGSSSGGNASNKHVLSTGCYGSGVGQPLVLRTATTGQGFDAVNDHLTIFPTGNVVIQNASQSATDAGFKLDVNGTARVTQMTFPATIDKKIFLYQGVSDYAIGLAAGAIRLGTPAGNRVAMGNYTGATFTEICNVSPTGLNLLSGRVDLGADTSNVKLAIYTNTGVSMGLGVSASTFRFSAGGTTNNFVFFDDAAGNKLYSLISLTGAGYYGSGTVDASSQLQVDSTTRGFLPPRMTTTQKNAISSPATGLMVYDTTLNLISVYNGTIWISL
jgi:hypothetical protein